MTLVGKIFTFLILVMSVAFLMLAATVFATHVNWRDKVMGSGDAKGLKAQVEEVSDTNRRLREEIERANDRLALEQASRAYALAGLQTKLQQAVSELQVKEKQFAELQAANGTAVTTLETNSESLKKISDENTQLRTDLRNAEQARDEKFNQVVQLTDKLNELEGVRQDLAERQRELLAQVSRMKVVLDHNNLNEFTPVVDIPPQVDGVVTAVSDRDLLEISIGSDDGLRVGHTLEVYRNNSYLGRVVVRRVEPDRAVVEILKEYRKGTVRKGDRVATKLS
jgi:chromosome segregation ATPase